ncbi:hypothetical protein TNCV_865081 [Trichonephila clavipes]|nr:hypothetical protein TNCV_865081 [Trichonephila clavipes]
MGKSACVNVADKATRGENGPSILNHGQVTMMHLRLYPSLISYHVTPTGGLRDTIDLMYSDPSTRQIFSGTRARISDSPATSFCP